MKIKQLQDIFFKTRSKTLSLVKNLSPEDMVIQSEIFVSPIKWHLAHTTWFFENFILRRIKKYKLFDKSFNYIFNSYYYSVGKFNPKDMRGFLNRPKINKFFNIETMWRKIFVNFLKDDLDKKNKPFINWN